MIKVLVFEKVSAILKVRIIKINKSKRFKMKIKEHKLQVLAALALAFSLGLTMPNAVFASEGTGVEASDEATEAELEAQPAEDELMAQSGDDELVAQASEEGIDAQAVTPSKTIGSAELFTAYTNVKASNDYKNFSALMTVLEPVQKDPTKATETQAKALATAIKAVDATAKVDGLSAAELVTYATSMQGFGLAQGAIAAVADIEKTVGSGVTVTAQLIADKMSVADVQACYSKIDAFVNRPTGTYADNIVKLNNRIKTDAGFDGYRKAETLVALTLKFEAHNESETDIANFQQQIKNLFPTVSGVDTANNDQLVEIAKSLRDFDKYAALYNATAFIREITKDGATLTAEAIKTALKEDSTIQQKYTEMARAAVAIDPEAGKGLLAFELPNTSAPETDKTAPNTGIVGLFKEDGSLDLMAVTLLGAASLATLSGVIMLAKLYLHHKF